MQDSRHIGGWPAALAIAVAAAEGATAALRPRPRARTAVPARVEDHFDAAAVARARAFGRPQLALSALAAALETGLLAWCARRPPAQLRRADRRPLAGAAGTGGALSLALTGCALPVSAVMRQRAVSAGLATQSWRGWAGDVAKSSAIGAAMAAGAATLAVALMRRYGDRWWLPGGVAAAAAAAALTFAGPVLFDPLFNTFTPLADDEVREDVLGLARAAGLQVENVVQVDASRRTSASNAYVNGLGASRRVVLFDTLLASFSRAETRLVVAHELAHVRHRDIPCRLLALALIAPVGLRAADRLARALDGGGRATPARLPALAVGLAVVGACVGPATNRLSRAVERRADRFALELTDDPASFTSFERRVVLANLADPDPPRWIGALLASHPSAVERIGIAQAYADQHP